MLTRLGSFARVAILDRRGIGLSDRLYPKDLPSLEVVMDDILMVMDEAGIERAAVFGWQSGATLAAPLAATYPARVSQLVVFGLESFMQVAVGSRRIPASTTSDVVSSRFPRLSARS
jgi:pimeloyl-ACP methyl ester carboxylesterase